ncbi:YlbF family regulator [Tissierella sp. MSJ-40]|uniref:YlbF family regulator n=1 Tax=Tissierella simiarum TaxID=2841534 RepID=A0ABS6EBB0_9FIRM|nr:YlbF family regulator [Tissierella simiarum]MBU5440220.1 YlbF family regulator [Tissierella simiarum]
MAQISGKEIPKEEIEKTTKLEEILMLNSDIKNFFMAELRFTQLMKDINDILLSCRY